MSTSITYSFNPASPGPIGGTTPNTATFTNITIGDTNALIFGTRARLIAGGASSLTIRNSADSGQGDLALRNLTAGGFATIPYIVSDLVTQSTPTTGQTVNAGTTRANETLYITPAGALVSLNINLPSAANSRVGQIIRGVVTQIVTNTTVSVSGGGTIVGSTTPDTSVANGTFAYLCLSVASNGIWAAM